MGLGDLRADLFAAAPTLLPELLTVLERCQELVLSAEVKPFLLDMSRATIDRCLGPTRFEVYPGLSTCHPVPSEE